MKFFLLVSLLVTSISVFAQVGVNHPGSFCTSDASNFTNTGIRNAGLIDNSTKSSMAYLYCPIMIPEDQRKFNLNVYIITTVFTMVPSRCRIISFDKFGRITETSSYLNVIKSETEDVILSFKNLRVSAHGTAQVQCNVEKGSFLSVRSYRTYY